MARGAEPLGPAQRARLRDTFVQDVQLVDGTARLAAMDLLLHGIGRPDGPSLIEVKDSLIAHPGRRWPVVLPNPPFGLKSSLTMVGADGRVRPARTWATVPRPSAVTLPARSGPKVSRRRR